MKKKRHVPLVVLGMACLAAGALYAQESKGTIFADRLQGKLKAGWSWVREAPRFWKVDPKGLHLMTSPGGLWEKANNNRNLLLRALPDGIRRKGVAIEVGVESAPKSPYEHAGLIWYHDDDNWVYLVKEHFEGKPHILLVGEKRGSPKLAGRYYKKPYGLKKVCLRLEFKGTELVGKYRESAKKAWHVLGRYKRPAAGKVRVGLTTGYGDARSKRVVTFRTFRIVAAAKNTK